MAETSIPGVGIATYEVRTESFYQPGYELRTAEDIRVDGAVPDAATKQLVEAHLKRLAIINQ
ncbi:hypothetical protein [Herbiconiux flava]|uniref:Uncharacterized protein n=1 Tax=Herbiconiux flava TaxID=881268 RepID=A0A852SNT9_9MICO|nr:hypothetical protein [Herbiconiux flava]NYD70433.1 hypothetical protein [Herbiconiux flava]GLK17188.1 hypothetical protein GCM10017602_16700 [Herbiconiux flava]